MSKEKIFLIGKEDEEISKKLKNYNKENFENKSDLESDFESTCGVHNFEKIYVIIFDELIEDYYKFYSQNFKNMYNLLINIFFCKNSYKHLGKDYINDSTFINSGVITSNFDYILEYIEEEQNNKSNNNKIKKNLSETDKNEIDIDLHKNSGFNEKYFYYFEDIKDLILPTFIKDLIKKMLDNKIIENHINKKDLIWLQNLLLYKYPLSLSKYILPSEEKIINVPYEILSKYFLYLYTMEIDEKFHYQFYSDLNRNLTHDILKKNNGDEILSLDIYRQYINILFYGIGNGIFRSFEYNEDNGKEFKLYRGHRMSKETFEKINKLFSEKENNKNCGIMLYIKNFFSFSKSEEIAKKFLEKKDDNYKILFVLEVKKKKNYYNNIEIDYDNTLFPEEEEVLFFPISCFIIKDIKNEGEIKKIELKFFDDYEQDIKDLKSNKKDENWKEKLENAFLNDYGKLVYNLYKDFLQIYEEHIEELYKEKIIAKKPNLNTEYSKEGNIVKVKFLEINYQRLDSISRNINIEEIEEVIYKINEEDIKKGYIRILGENKKGDDFLKINKDKAYLIINGKKEDLCYTYKIDKGKNEFKIKFVFTKKITDLSYLFSDCTSLSNISALRNWDVKNVTNFSFLFNNCSSLTDISALETWNVSKGINFTCLFGKCSSLKDIWYLHNWNVENGEHFSYLFYECSSLVNIGGLKKWNVGKGKFFSCLFSGCIELYNISPLRNWNVKNGIFFNYLFDRCISLKKTIDLQKWDVSNGNYFDHLFCDCKELFDLSGLKDWKVNNVCDFSYSFYNCFSLTDLSPIKNWNVRNGKKFLNMFNNYQIDNNTKPDWFYKVT